MYGLKHSSHIWYKHFKEYLVKEVYNNYPIYPCVFIKKFELKFAIIKIYVDDSNLIRTLEELFKIAEYLNKFEVKDLSKIKLCLCLELEHKINRILFHQLAYTERVLKHFNMDKAHQLSTPMVVRLFNPKMIHFDVKNLMKKYLVLKYHHSMELGLSCTWHNT